jgi:hypothetical protein
MLCTFTTSEGKTLVIRSDDIRVIEDRVPSNGEGFLVWMIGDERQDRVIRGTAAENRDRILQEELDQIGHVEAHRFNVQKQLQAGYPVPPIKRGRQ